MRKNGCIPFFRHPPPSTDTKSSFPFTKRSQPMSGAKDKALAINLRLKSSDPSAHPRAANYTNVGVAQGIAYVDFGFIEPALLGTISKTAKDGQAAPKHIEGQLVTRVAMSVDVLARLHGQIQQVLMLLRDTRQAKEKN
jgi:hypothetical protein